MQAESGSEQQTEDNERILMSIWKDVLGIQEMSRDSNFFELGGDSLQMMTMLFRIKQDMGTEVDPGTVFDCPTPAQLAIFITMGQQQIAADGQASEGVI